MDREEQPDDSTSGSRPDSESLLKPMWDSLPINAIFKDPQGRIQFANRLFCNNIGHSMDELRGKTDFDLFPPPFAEKFRRDDESVLQRIEVLHNVEQFPSPLGDLQFVEVFKAPVQDATGAILGIQILFWDVTERKLSETLPDERRNRLGTLSQELFRLPQQLENLRKDATTEAEQTISALNQAIQQTAAELAALSQEQPGLDLEDKSP